jgi:hypothetical protein
MQSSPKFHKGDEKGDMQDYVDGDAEEGQKEN